MRVRDDKGELRWKVMSWFHIRVNDIPLIDRLRIVQTPLFGLYLHLIRNEDPDRDPHDHPWDFVSFVLRGGYMEMFWPDAQVPDNWSYRRHGRFSLHIMQAEWAHRTIEVLPNTVTLVLVGPKKEQLWGFWIPDFARAGRAYYIDWKTYRKVGVAVTA